ncbi:MAG: bacteriohemerythrin [Halopseudomonas sp.]
MDVIEWKNEYSVHHSQLDQQHQRLIVLINTLTQATLEGGAIGYVFDELDFYVKEHFRFEEQLLDQARYSDFAAHKAEHLVFEQWLWAVRRSFGEGGVSAPLLADSVNAYLRSWLISHILQSDMAYSGVIES